MKKFAFLISITLISLSSFAQGGYLRSNTTYGQRFYRLGIDSTLFFPTGSGAPSGTASLRGYNLMQGAFYFDSTGGKVYVFNPKTSTWSALGSGIGTLTSIYAGLWLTKVNDSTLAGDSASMAAYFLRRSDSTIYYPYRSNPLGYLTTVDLAGYELLANKAIDFGVINNTKYPTTLAVVNYVTGLGYVPQTRTLTINGTAHDLSTDRSWTVGTVTQAQLDDSTAAIRSDFPVVSGGGIHGVYAGWGLISVNDSTLKADSFLVASRARLLKVLDSIQVINNANLALKLNITDTAAMVGAYFRDLQAVTGGARWVRGNGTADTLLLGGIDTSYLHARGVASFGKNAGGDSIILVLNDGTRLAAKDSIGSGGGSGVTTLAAIGSTPNANAGTISSTTLNLQPADSTYGGVVTVLDQYLKGVKRFQSDIHVNNNSNIYMNNPSGTNRSFSFKNFNAADNLPTMYAYPSSGTNVGMSLTVIPKGTGFTNAGQNIRSQVSVFNTDVNVDASNYEAGVFRAAGTKILLSSFKNGTGALLPLVLSAGQGFDETTNANQFVLNANGSLSANGLKAGSGTPSILVHMPDSTIANMPYPTVALTVGSSTITSGTNTKVLFNNSGVLGEYSVTGTGTTVALNTNPVFSANIFTPSTTMLLGTGTNRDVKFYVANSGADNFTQPVIYPYSGTNVGVDVAFIPKGTGLSSTFKSQFGVFNTDFIADGTNYEVAKLRAGGTDGFILFTYKAGTGTQRPLCIDATGAISTSAANMTFKTNGGISVPATNTATGTTGAQTINKTGGKVNFAAAASTLVVTNSLVTTASIVHVQVEGTDATATSARVTVASGSFTITLNAAATAETKVSFLVVN